MKRNAVFLSPRELGSNLLIVLLLGLGMGAVALLYTALDRLLLHPIQLQNQDRMVRVGEINAPITSWNYFPYSFYQSMQKLHSFDALAVEGEVDTAVTNESGTEPAVGSMVSGNFFALLGARAELGRTLTSADDSATTTVPIVLSHRFWVQELGALPEISGVVVRLQGKPFMVVGVMPESFFGTKLDASPDFWLPLSAQALLSTKALTDADPDRAFSIVGRLREGVTRAQAQSEFSALYRTVRGRAEARTQALIAPIAEGSFAMREQFSRALQLLLWGVAILMSMVCASVAGMLVARAVRRERETAVRIALGAGRLVVAKDVLSESLTLGVWGASIGIGFAYLGAPLLKSLLPVARTPLPVSLSPSFGVICLVCALALVISVVFGAAPSFLSMRVAPHLALRGGSATRRSESLSRALLIFETGATLVLLTVTGLLLHTMYSLRRSDPGFDVQHVVSFALDLNVLGKNTERSAVVTKELEQQVLGLPGVRAAGFSVAEIMGRFGMRTSVALPGQQIASQAFLNTYVNRTSSGFFDAMGIPLLSGREFQEQDLARSSPTPVIVNEAFTRRFFSGEDPVGKQFGMGSTGEVAKREFVVVGSVGDSKYRSPREAFLPIFYTPLHGSDAEGAQIYFYVKTTGNPNAIIHSVRTAMFHLDPRVPFSNVETMSERMDDSLWQERLLVTLATVFSGISILVAGVGMYGLLAYDASRRIREFGIRTALGARKQDIGKLMVWELVLILVPGLGFGFIVCRVMAGAIAPALYEISPYDATAWAGAVFAVVCTGVVALLQPMRRALAAEPAIVLREE